VGVQEVRWEGSGTEPAGEYRFFYGKGNENHELGTVYLCIRESCQQLRGWWCHIIVLYVHAPKEDKTDNSLILFGIRKNCLISGRSILLYQFTKRVTKLTVIIIVGYHCCQLHIKFYRISYSQG
jgi:hypothetical protein